MRASIIAGICILALCDSVAADPPRVPVVPHPAKPLPRIVPEHPAMQSPSRIAPLQFAPAHPARYFVLRDSAVRAIVTHTAAWHPEWDKSREHQWNGNRYRWRNGRWFPLAEDYLPNRFDSVLPAYAPIAAYAPLVSGPQSTYNPYFSFNSGPIFYPMYVPADASRSFASPGEGNGDPVVRRIQGRLQEEGYYRGRSDGVLGDSTRAALRSYQAAQGLRVTGEVDPPVLQAFGLE